MFRAKDDEVPGGARDQDDEVPDGGLPHGLPHDPRADQRPSAAGVQRLLL